MLLGGLFLVPLCIGCGGLQTATLSSGNPQVAEYVVTLSKPGAATVYFGETTSYGYRTAAVHTSRHSGLIHIEVAGMLANTTYHMQLRVQYDDGTKANDIDRTFTTGSYPTNAGTTITASTASGQTPQPGVEILNPVPTVPAPSDTGIQATDLSGNIIWAYHPPDSMGTSSWEAPKLMANGDFLALAAPPLEGIVTSVPAGSPDLVREFDLAGNTIKQITMAQLNARLAAANYNLQMVIFHHDVTPLPNGHWLVLGNVIKSIVLNTGAAPTPVQGSAIVDLNQNLQPVWVWNEFDHEDVARHPWSFPDWTHTNAIIYSPTDGNIVVSQRHQNWLLKIDYNNGAGTGNIIWHFGVDGDFKLVGGVDPTDWNFAQHGISFTTSNTAGIFGIAMMNNGDDRQLPGGPEGITCGSTTVPGSSPCYTNVPIYQLSESTMTAQQTATLTFNQNLPGSLYSYWGGNAEVLANGHVEYDLCGLPTKTLSSQVEEVTNSATPQTVWTLNHKGLNLYRAYRLPSLYPGVQW